MTTVTKAGRYEIVSELGRGAMGVVYKATDPVIGRVVAVKTIRLSEQGTGLSRPELLNRFQTEARAAGLLTHPNIVVVFDAGEEDGLYYITMELVEGKSLQALIEAGQPFGLARVLRIIEQTGSALQFAHERNVVHRDIKPANLMLTADDTVKVTDFGTAKILQFGSIQQTAHVMGTPSYMSPEQVKGRAVDGRSDIFSLGVMFYELLTGEKPFPGESITAVIYKIVNEQPRPPRELNPSIHPGVNAVVLKALEKEPEQRYQSCREMLEDLRSYRSLGAAGGNPQATMVMGSMPAPTATVSLHSMNAAGGNANPMMAATVRSLNSRAAHPGQTPVVRRTGTVVPYQEPKKSNVFATILASIFLLGVIIFGAQKLRPVFEVARQLHEAQKHAASQTDATMAHTTAINDSTIGAPSDVPTQAQEGADHGAVNLPATTTATETLTPAKEVVVLKAAPKNNETTVSSKAAEYKEHIEEALLDKGFAGRAKVEAVGNTLTLAGRLRPMEHAALLKVLRDAPADVRVVDHLEYDDAPLTGTESSDEGAHPVPEFGRGAIHVVTDVIGANALLHGPAGHLLSQCQTPCSFNNLKPARYTLDIQKDGYRPTQAAVEVKSNEALDQRIRMETLTQGLFVNSRPRGADVFINGAKQATRTPVTLTLGAGAYNVVLRIPGYDAYAGTVQVKENVQTQLDVQLQETSTTRVAWAQVQTNPKGAEIVLDGTSTGQVTPARVQIPSGLHNMILKLAGYQPLHRTFQVTEGSTVTVDGALIEQK